ncbi:MAG: DNA repair protein RecO [Acidobacteriia bacterium]|nr:DNA repair protein RecO [Terriglobia bacterium]
MLPKRVSEAIVLRTYPLREADLVVSFFSRDQGKLRGVARRARRPKSPFGAGLERLSHARLSYYQRETRELVNLDSCDLIRSQFDLVTDYRTSLALDYIAEVADQLLPPEEANEKFFRLMLAVLESLRSLEPGSPTNPDAGLWRGVTYFTLWSVRLSGWLPVLDVCLACGSVLTNARTSFSRGRSGLTCEDCRRTLGLANHWELTAQSREIAAAILRRPVSQISEAGWSGETAADLRRFLVQQIETHVERRLVTASMLEEAAAPDRPAARSAPVERAAF